MMLVLAAYGVACSVSLLGSFCIEAWRLLSDRCPPPWTTPLAAVFAVLLSPLVLLLTLFAWFGDITPQSLASLAENRDKLERGEGHGENDDNPDAKTDPHVRGRLSLFKRRDAVHRLIPGVGAVRWSHPRTALYLERSRIEPGLGRTTQKKFTEHERGVGLAG